jgi:hypothetical protein
MNHPAPSPSPSVVHPAEAIDSQAVPSGLKSAGASDPRPALSALLFAVTTASVSGSERASADDRSEAGCAYEVAERAIFALARAQTAPVGWAPVMPVGRYRVSGGKVVEWEIDNVADQRPDGTYTLYVTNEESPTAIAELQS